MHFALDKKNEVSYKNNRNSEKLKKSQGGSRK